MIDTIISSSVLIVIILTIRFMFKGKINPMVQYGLWSLVVLRLAAFSWLNPHPIESALSLMNAVNSAEITIRGASSAEQVIAGNAEAGTIDNAVLIMDNVKTGVMTSGKGISAAAAIDWQLVIMIVWAVGAFALVLWLILVNRKFGKKIFENRTFLMSIRADNKGKLAADEIGLIHEGTDMRKTKLLPVYVVEELDSPCLMGYRGEVAIYVPSEVAADKEKLRFAIAHELCHYKHHDLIWAIVRGSLLVFYWFNPLVWVAAIMSKRDCELACDYGVLKAIGKEERLAYGRALVDLIRQSDHKSDVLQMATTMYGSANGIKERVTMIAKNKKMKAATLSTVLLIVILAVGCTFTSAQNNIADLSEEDKTEIEAFAIKWADAFSARDADTIYSLCENEELYLTIGDIEENEKGKYYWMGWSSPWPWGNDYVIDLVDSSHIDIYYYFKTSTPSVYVAKETITVKKIEDEYKAMQVTMKHFDRIESKADFDEAYKFGFYDFTKFAAAYQTQADENAWNMTEILENPTAAAVHQLNLAGAKVSGTYEDRNTEPPIFVVKFTWDDGEAEVNLIQPMLTDENGAKRQASIWVVVNEDPANNGTKNNDAATNDPQHIEKISSYMEEHSTNVFSPYYELLDFQISNYHEEIVNGKVEAVFQYKIIHKNYDRDPDTVKYIKEAKESGDSNYYQRLYDEYLQPKDMNFDSLKTVIDENGEITLYSKNLAIDTDEWKETKMSDYIIKN
ncbi:MAG: M56 family metallopeptidase [Eubacteriales bacterium]|nr:M56 family metallopeptidase [Eubacteriales bacterium]